MDSHYKSFPACMCDTTLATRKAWKQMARKAWKAGNWDSVWNDLEMVPFEKVSGPIVACNDAGRFWRTEEPVWQVNWVSEVSFAMPEELNAYQQKQFDLTMAGMKYLWFTIGMLTRAYNLQYFVVGNSSLITGRHFNTKGIQEIVGPWLSAYINWLPELLALKGRLKRGARGVGLRPFDCGKGLSIIFMIAYDCGYLPEKVVQECHTLDEDGVVRTLIDFGVIKENSGRYIFARSY